MFLPTDIVLTFEDAFDLTRLLKITKINTNIIEVKPRVLFRDKSFESKRKHRKQ